tara:strand:+ start:963 stop:1223 length:261 start_codon:yes stop_codon:yes gene_type:complete
MTKIYESPDGGKTVYEREFGSSVRKVIEAHGLTMSEVSDMATDDIWKEGPFPDWVLMREHPELKEEYEKYLKLQDQYRLNKQISNK